MPRSLKVTYHQIRRNNILFSKNGRFGVGFHSSFSFFNYKVVFLFVFIGISFFKAQAKESDSSQFNKLINKGYQIYYTNIDSGLYYYNLAEKIGRKLKNAAMISIACRFKGEVELSKLHIVNAQVLFKEAEKYAEISGRVDLKMDVICSKLGLFSEIIDIKNVSNLVHVSEKICSKLGKTESQRQLAVVYATAANAYLGNNQYDSALFFTNLFYLNNFQGNYRENNEASVILIEVYSLTQLGQTKKAELRYKVVEKLIDQYKMEFLRPILYNYGLRLYSTIGNIPVAKSLLDTMIQFQNEGKLTDFVSLEILYSKYLIDSTLGNIALAKEHLLLYYENYVNFLKKKEQLRMSSEVELINTKLNETEAILEMNKTESRYYKYKLWSIIIGFIVILTAIFIYFWWKRKKLLHKNQLIKSQLKVLRAQINSHFISNTLNAIGGYISGNNNKEAINYLGKFSKMMRSCLYYSDLDWISLEDEKTFLANYLELESLRYGIVVNYTFESQIKADYNKILIPSMLLQPLIENIMQHGFKLNKIEEAIITVNVSLDSKNFVLIEIIDNAPKPHVDDGFTKIGGRKIVMDRLKLYMKNEKQSNFSIDRIVNKNRLKLTVPIINETND